MLAPLFRMPLSLLLDELSSGASLRDQLLFEGFPEPCGQSRLLAFSDLMAICANLPHGPSHWTPVCISSDSEEFWRVGIIFLFSCLELGGGGVEETAAKKEVSRWDTRLAGFLSINFHKELAGFIWILQRLSLCHLLGDWSSLRCLHLQDP